MHSILSDKQAERTFSVRSSNICKALSISAIVYFHCITCMDPSAYILSLSTLKNILFETSFVWVSVFLFLSAYGYALQSTFSSSLSLRSYAKTTRKRLGKLYSQYWFIFLFALVLSPVLSPNWMDARYIYGSDSIVFRVIRAFLNFFGVHHIIYGDNVYTLNQTWWYVSICVLLILFIPIIIRLYQSNKSLVIWGALILSSLFVNVRYMRYLLVIVSGVAFADQQVFEYSDKLYRKSPLLFITIYVYIIFFVVLFPQHAKRYAKNAIRYIIHSFYTHYDFQYRRTDSCR